MDINKAMTLLEQVGGLALAFSVMLGALGTSLEALGTRFARAWLVAIGQRLEAASFDIPKFIRGSRKTAEEKADKQPVTQRGFITLRELAVGSLLGFGAAVAVIVMTSCSPAATTEAKGAEASRVTRVVFGATSLALQKVADMTADWFAAQQTVEQAQAALPVKAKLVPLLDGARDALEHARPFLDRGDSGAVMRQVAFVLDALEQALPILEGVGKKPPPELLEALDFVRGFVGGAP